MNSRGNIIIRIALTLTISFLLASGIFVLAHDSPTLKYLIFDVYKEADLLMTMILTMLLVPVIYIFLKVSLWGTVIVFTILLLGYGFLFSPKKVSSGDVGPYSNGQMVYGVSRQLVVFRPLNINDMVYVGPGNGMSEGVVQIVGLPGNSYILDGFPEDGVGSVVPMNSYLVDYGNGIGRHIIPESQITYLIWYPLDW